MEQPELKKAKRFKQGLYTPTNPEKYIGDLNKINYRSSWELSMNKFLDNNVKVIRWAVEPWPIQYLKPTTGRIHKYFPDYYIELLDKNNRIRKIVMEIKPESQTKKTRSRNPKNKLYEEVQFAVNTAKWQACKAFCDQHGLEFQLVTEKTMKFK